MSDDVARLEVLLDYLQRTMEPKDYEALLNKWLLQVRLKRFRQKKDALACVEVSE